MEVEMEMEKLKGARLNWKNLNLIKDLRAP